MGFEQNVRPKMQGFLLSKFINKKILKAVWENVKACYLQRLMASRDVVPAAPFMSIFGSLEFFKCIYFWAFRNSYYLYKLRKIYFQKPFAIC